jgi:hypothetical protein
MTETKSTATARPVKGQTDKVTTHLDNIINTLHYLQGSLRQYGDVDDTDEPQTGLDGSSMAGLSRIVQTLEQDAQDCFADYNASQTNG